MSHEDRNSGTHFLNLSAYNRFRNLISRRSDSSVSDAESIQSSWAEEQGAEEQGHGHGHLTLSAYNRFRSMVSRRSGSSISDADSIQSPQAEEQVFSTRGRRERGFSKALVSFFLKPQTFFGVPAEEDPEIHLGQLKRFSLRELQVATDSFSNKKILGRGAFGNVYEGRLTDGSLVAVKRLEEHTPGGELQFQTKVEMISMAVHRNLLRLRGFCMTPTERLLVYPVMANGSVASCLRGRSPSEPPLDWPTRRRVALGSARGLSYLHDHSDPKIIHRDVNAANILLDEEFEAVVGGFSLAKLMDCKVTHVTTTVCGTIGHIAPEYFSTGKCSEKTDVFGYGIMLLELITGQSDFDLARLANDDDVMLLDWVKGLLKEKRLEMLVDPDLQNNYIETEVESLIQVALLCTQGSPMERPKMSEVVRMLEGDGLAERWEEWQKPRSGDGPSPLRMDS